MDAFPLVVEQVLAAWNSQNNQLNTLLNNLSDEHLSRHIAPGKNSGTYILGHITAISDALLPLLGYGNRLFSDYDHIFVHTPESSGPAQPSVHAIRQAFEAVNSNLTEHIWKTSISDWLQAHNSITPEAFASEPHRNKLNVIINRTNHLAYHLGQLVLLKSPV